MRENSGGENYPREDKESEGGDGALNGKKRKEKQKDSAGRGSNSQKSGNITPHQGKITLKEGGESGIREEAGKFLDPPR